MLKKLLGFAATLAVLTAPSLVKAPEANAQYIYYEYGPAYVCTKSSPLNVRYGPGTEYAVYTSFAKGTQIWYMDEAYASNGRLWYQVSDGYSYGWVSSGYVCFY